MSAEAKRILANPTADSPAREVALIGVVGFNVASLGGPLVRVPPLEMPTIVVVTPSLVVLDGDGADVDDIAA